MTQIIERVARAMYNREHKATPWELVKPTLRQDYINLAQAALKEIKFDLKKAHDLILNSPMGSHMTDEAMEILHALLSELEKTNV